MNYFGAAVYVAGDIALIGAKGEDVNGVRSGSAYAYRFDRPANIWEMEQRLVASDKLGNAFGRSISLCEDWAIIEAPDDDDNGFGSGSAYLYRKNQLTHSWVEEQKLTASDGAQNDYFGDSVSISGNVALVGSWFDDDLGNASGSAYIFDLEKPIQLTIVKPPLQSGRVDEFTVSGAFPFKPIALVYSLDGGSCSQSISSLNVTIEICNVLSQPGNPLTTGIADANGDVRWELIAPVVHTTTPIWYQAVQKGQITPVVSVMIEPQ